MCRPGALHSLGFEQLQQLLVRAASLSLRNREAEAGSVLCGWASYPPRASVGKSRREFRFCLWYRNFPCPCRVWGRMIGSLDGSTPAFVPFLTVLGTFRDEH